YSNQRPQQTGDPDRAGSLRLEVEAKGLLGQLRDPANFPFSDGEELANIVLKGAVLREINHIGESFQWVVDFVGNGCSKPSYRGKSFGGVQCTFRLLVVGDVPRDFCGAHNVPGFV